MHPQQRLQLRGGRRMDRLLLTLELAHRTMSCSQKLAMRSSAQVVMQVSQERPWHSHLSETRLKQGITSAQRVIAKGCHDESSPLGVSAHARLPCVRCVCRSHAHGSRDSFEFKPPAVPSSGAIYPGFVVGIPKSESTQVRTLVCRPERFQHILSSEGCQ